MGKTADTTEQENLGAVRKDGRLIQFIKNPSENVQLGAVQNRGDAIQFIKNPSEGVQLSAVADDGYSIIYIKNPSEAVQLEAVRQNGSSVRYIKKPSEDVAMAAVQEYSSWALRYIKSPSKNVRLTAFSHGGGFLAAGLWPKAFQPSVQDLNRAIQASELLFSGNKPRHGSAGTDSVGRSVDRIEDNLYEKGVKNILTILKKHSADDVLDLAAIAPALFEPPKLRKALRDALLKQAEPIRMPAKRRPM